MKKLNEKGFAISAILYTMLILMVLLMFLILAVLDNGRTTANKLSSKVKEEIDNTKYENGIVKPIKNGLYEAVQAAAGDKTDENINFFPTVTSGSSNYPIVNLQENGAYLKSETANDLNPVYYYRGNVDNWVVFDNKCWRIVRTTSTRGVKLIYSGVPVIGAYDFTTGTAPASCNSVEWNLVYGGTAGKSIFAPNTSTSRDYEKSTIKTVVDKILSDEIAFDEYLETMELCNDTTNDTWNYLITPPKTPQEKLKINCGKTIESKIGLLDAEELIRAGGIITDKQVRINYYLRIEQSYPNEKDGNGNKISYLNVNYAIMTGGIYVANGTSYLNSIMYVGGEGQVAAYHMYNSYGVRPVISLAAGATYEEGGIGTKDKPYVIVGANA